MRLRPGMYWSCFLLQILVSVNGGAETQPVTDLRSDEENRVQSIENGGRANDDIRPTADLSTALDRLKDATRLANEGRYRDAQALGRSAIEQIRASSDNRKIWARALAAQAQIEMEMYEHRVASQMFAAALLVTRDEVDFEEFRVAVALNLAYSISKQGDHDQANNIVEATIRNLQYDSPPQLLTDCELRHGYCLLNLGRIAEARKSCNAATAYSTQLQTPHPRMRAAIIKLDGEIAIGEHRTDDAVKILENACNEFRQSFGPKSVQYTESLVSLAEAYIAANQRAPAKAVLAKVELDVTSQIGDRHPLAQQLQKIRNDTEVSDR